MKPYIIDRIVDPDTGKVIYQAEKTELDRVLKQESVNKIKELMRSVINGNCSNSSGYYYYMDGYDFIGKTGTAQVASENGKGYTDETISGLAGMFPGNDPQVIFYMAIKNQSSGYKESAFGLTTTRSKIPFFLRREESFATLTALLNKRESLGVCFLLNEFRNIF